jgi:DNA-binding NarL/FixJ family response regulator
MRILPLRRDDRWMMNSRDLGALDVAYPRGSDIGMAPEAADPPLEGLLTERELEVFALMAEGATNAEIADRLYIAKGTVKTHVKNILRKLGVRNRTQAVARYLHR